MVPRAQNWFILDFCRLGFIGKMFKTDDLPLLIQAGTHSTNFYKLGAAVAQG
jgi:nitric oxide synthase oxygenase domain/subunit